MCITEQFHPYVIKEPVFLVCRCHKFLEGNSTICNKLYGTGSKNEKINISMKQILYTCNKQNIAIKFALIKKKNEMTKKYVTDEGAR